MAMSLGMDSSYVSRISREEFLKKRFACLIQKSQKALEKTESGTTAEASSDRRCCKKVVDTERMRQRRNKIELQRKEPRRKAEIQKRREAARREIEQMRNTSGMCDPQQVMRDFEKLIGYSNNNNAESTHVSMTPYGSNTLLFKFGEVTGLKGSAHCYDRYKESLCQTKKPKYASRAENCRGQVNNVEEEVEEGEITD